MYIAYKHYLRASRNARPKHTKPSTPNPPNQSFRGPTAPSKLLNTLQRRSAAAQAPAPATPPAPTPPLSPQPTLASTFYQRVWQLLRWLLQGDAPLARVQAQLEEAHRLTLHAQDQESMARDLQRRTADLLGQASASYHQAVKADKEAEQYLRRAKRRMREAWCAPSRIPINGPQLNVIHALAPWGVRADQIHALDPSLEEPITHLLEDLFDLAEAASVDTRKLVRRARALAPGSDINLEIKRDYWKYIDPHHDVSLDLDL